MAAQTVTQKLIDSHLQSGSLVSGAEISINVDQTLMQDATGTLVMLELEALNISRIQTELSALYVDHNLMQADYKNPDDHLFLQSACERFGIHFSRPGNGISHVLHMSRLGRPGKTLLGSDSHTCAGGALGMLAIGSGGLDVAMAMTGVPYFFVMPKIWGVYLEGELPEWVSAKDIILELLRRHGVSGGVNKILEYHGPGVEKLSAMDRHVIANMGAELGATTSVFPSDKITYEFMKANDRGDEWVELKADGSAQFDLEEKIDLAQLQPLIAKPSSPGNVVPVEEITGEKIYQAYIGSSANPGYRDFAMAAEMVRDKQIPSGVSFDVNISSREIMENLIRSGHLHSLLRSGARIHQIGCNGCIGMGQAPASGQNSIRTVPRNFPGRSGTKEDRVWLSSPETATASALRGEITDPRTLGIPYPQIEDPTPWLINTEMIELPLPKEKAKLVSLIKGPNISSIPHIEPISDNFAGLVALKVDDNISTDEILPAGLVVLPYRSNINKIAEFAFNNVDPSYVERVRSFSQHHVIIAGENYGQGSSREHAALAPAHLGLRMVLAKSFARIHWQNLISFGVLPLEFTNHEDFESLDAKDEIKIKNLEEQLKSGRTIGATVNDEREMILTHSLSTRQIEILVGGGLLLWKKAA